MFAYKCTNLSLFSTQFRKKKHFYYEINMVSRTIRTLTYHYHERIISFDDLGYTNKLTKRKINNNNNKEINTN